MVLSLCVIGPVRTITVSEDGSREFDNIQAGIDAAVDGDTVLVYAGLYRGEGRRDLDFQGKAIVVRSLDPNDWNVVADTIIDCQGSESQPHRGFHFHSGERPDSVVEGLTITGGHAESYGGAIFCEAGSGPTISKCIIADNTCGIAPTGRAIHPPGFGAGIACVDRSDATISHCIISSNFNFSLRYESAGGGVYCDVSAPLISDCIVAGNQARSGGGVVAGARANVTVRNCIIR